MPADIVRKKRESLIQDIFSILGQWSELERSIFCQAHYQGLSVAAISRALQMNAEDVHKILGQCDRRLIASLSDSYKNDPRTSSIPMIDTGCPAA